MIRKTGRERSVFGGRVIVCLSAAAMLVLGACASLPPLPPSKAQLNMETNSEELGRPLVSDTEDEGTLLGGLLGGGITFGAGGGRNQNVNMALPIGMFAGSVAGRYVAGKQAQFSKEAEVAEAITRDVRDQERTRRPHDLGDGNRRRGTSHATGGNSRRKSEGTG